MNTTRTSRHTIVTLPLGGARFSTSVREHTVLVDQPVAAGGADTAPTPLELMSVSLASCVAYYVHRYCEQRSLEADDLAVTVTPVWRRDPGRIGRFDVAVRIPTTVPEAHHAAIEATARGCPVHHTLTHPPEITTRLETAAAIR